MGLALASIDSQGVISGQAYRTTLDRPVEPASIAGTIKISPDCTGTVEWGDGVKEDLVVVREGEEMQSVMTAASSPPIVSGRWKRISRVPSTVDPAQCSPGNLVGTYMSELHGFSLDFNARVVPMAAVIPGSMYPDGAVVASGTGTTGGQTASITVNTQATASPDCTFRFAHPGRPADLWGVVLDGGNELWGISLNGWQTGTWHRISTQP